MASIHSSLLPKLKPNWRPQRVRETTTTISNAVAKEHLASGAQGPRAGGAGPKRGGNADPILINRSVLIGGCQPGFSGESDHCWPQPPY